MDITEKRKEYWCKSCYVTLDDIPTWSEYASKIMAIRPYKDSAYMKDERLNNKVSIFVGDIMCLEIDAIVNSNKGSFLCGTMKKKQARKSTNVINEDIHKASGSALFAECISIEGWHKGVAEITEGYKFPAKYIVHTAGPLGMNPNLLRNCYFSCLNLAEEKGIKSIAFPCISTGLCGYPNRSAAEIALKTVREFLELNVTQPTFSHMERIIFCLFKSIDVGIYESLMPNYFPT